MTRTPTNVVCTSVSEEVVCRGTLKAWGIISLSYSDLLFVSCCLSHLSHDVIPVGKQPVHVAPHMGMIVVVDTGRGTRSESSQNGGL